MGVVLTAEMQADPGGDRSHAGQGPYQVPIRTLLPGHTPRLNGVDEQHVRLLTESEAPLPPILVQRGTGRVVDGWHRLCAALLRGQDTIDVEYFDGGEAEAFVTAVRVNTMHGLPLTTADRKAAVARIVISHPQYSDRAIATITGLSAKTVGSIRRQVQLPESRQGQVTRIGRDGRTRPTNSAHGRLAVQEAVTKHPSASLREIARIAGVSPATARDVRKRLIRGEGPVPANQHPDASGPETAKRRLGAEARPPGMPQQLRDRAALLDSLSRDPALRFTESGRSLLRWLLPRADGLNELPKRAHGVPSHCLYTILELAISCAAEWQNLAAYVETHLRDIA